MASSSNAFQADYSSVHHYTGQSCTLPEALYSLSCLSDLYEIGNVLGTEIDARELREHILTHLSQVVCAQGSCLLLYHQSQQRFIPVASLGERVPTAKLIAALEDWAIAEQQFMCGPGEMLAMLEFDNLYMIVVTLSDKETLQGVAALAVTERNTLMDERCLLLAFMGKIAGLLLRNADFSNRVRQDAINQERSRIAREIHDGTMQQITHVLHKLEYIQHLLKRADQDLLSELQYVRNILNGSLQELRQTMSGLFAGRIEKRALVETIQRLVDRYKVSHPEAELQLKIVGFDESQHISAKLEMTISQCIQEALTNIWKHARATYISVQLARLHDWLVVEVRDNGIGFLPEEVLIASQRREGDGLHFGLSIMRERVEEAGGFWELDSRPGEGTTIRARFPLAILIGEPTK